MREHLSMPNSNFLQLRTRLEETYSLVWHRQECNYLILRSVEVMDINFEVIVMGSFIGQTLPQSILSKMGSGKKINPQIILACKQFLNSNKPESNECNRY